MKPGCDTSILIDRRPSLKGVDTEALTKINGRVERVRLPIAFGLPHGCRDVRATRDAGFLPLLEAARPPRIAMPASADILRLQRASAGTGRPRQDARQDVFRVDHTMGHGRGDVQADQRDERVGGECVQLAEPVR